MKGKLNAYRCSRCAGQIVTIDRDEGVTPFMLSCLATEDCRGTMHSSCYVNVSGTPTFQWRRPTEAEYSAASVAMKRHFDMGGLEIHPIEAKMKAYSIQIPVELRDEHDRAMLAGFFEAVAKKFVEAEVKHGWNSYWREAEEKFVQASIQEHVAKGDPRDVAVLCAIAYTRGFSTKGAGS